MKKTVTFYVLFELRDLEFLAQNNFRELPFNEIPYAFKQKEIEIFAERLKQFKDNILISANVECDIDKFKEYRESHPDENPTESGGLSETQTNTFNYSLIDKIKIENVFGKNLQNYENEKILSILEFEKRFFEFRLKAFLITNSREIISHDDFVSPIVEKQDPENFTDEQIKQQIEEVIEEQERVLKKAKERTATINSVEEAVEFLINEDLDQTKLDEIKNKSLVTRFDDCGEHFGYNMYLRNVFIYPNKNQIFLENLRNYNSHYVTEMGEFGEGIIEDLLWRKVNNCETTKDNSNKIEKIQKQIKEGLEFDSYWNLTIKMKLLSYNLNDSEIESYLKLENMEENDKDNFDEYYYQKKALLARLNEKDRQTFERLKQDYFNIQKVINKLKQKP
ncbi:hypothetical protein [Chryseobacterium sp. Hurlbut01]|uniref:hypothetical protein n=1 Tax=Chryseobacterium sp. Hurlbut01 TaxID=1681828 RepID=UPI00067AB1F3|nr:hypothetical protein [Chryseobacterium sp. Hurlbut01]KNB62153.1 hypothetical protein AC804_04525 [Chryseobacterium sp. Hurlbut01]